MRNTPTPNKADRGLVSQSVPFCRIQCHKAADSHVASLLGMTKSLFDKLASPCGRGGRAKRGRRGQTECAHKLILSSPKGCKTLSVTCGDSSPKGRAQPVKKASQSSRPAGRESCSIHFSRRRPPRGLPLGVYVAKNTLRWPRPRGTGLGRPDG